MYIYIYIDVFRIHIYDLIDITDSVPTYTHIQHTRPNIHW